MLVQNMATLDISTMAHSILNCAIIEMSKVAIFCTSILWEIDSESNFIQDYHNMFVQNMPSLAVAIAVAREKNIKKNQFF